MTLSFSIALNSIESNRIIHKMGTQDQTTGLQNRNLNTEKWKNKRFDSIACIYIDANGLHEINNKFGHTVGERML